MQICNCIFENMKIIVAFFEINEIGIYKLTHLFFYNQTESRTVLLLQLH